MLNDLIPVANPQTAEEMKALAKAVRTRLYGASANSQLIVAIDRPPTPVMTPVNAPRLTVVPICQDEASRLDAEQKAQWMREYHELRNFCFRLVDGVRWAMDMPPQFVAAREVREYVVYVSEVEWHRICSRFRMAGLVRARKLAMWSLFKFSYMSLPQIGVYMGRDHTTVIYGRDWVDDALRAVGHDKEPDLQNWREHIEIAWRAINITKHCLRPKLVSKPSA